MINKQTVTSSIELIKAKFRRLFEDIRFLRSTPQFAKFAKMCEPLVAKLPPIKQRIANACSKSRPKVGSTAPHEELPVNPQFGTDAQAVADACDRTMPVEINVNVVQPKVAAPQSQGMQRREVEPSAQPKRAAKPRRSIAEVFSGLSHTVGRWSPSCVLAIVAALIGWASWKTYQSGDFVALAAVVVVGVGALLGCWRGILGLVASLAGVAVASFTAPYLGVACESFVAEQLGTSGILNRTLSVSIVGLLAYLAFMLVSTLVIKQQPDDRSFFAKLLGLVGGVAQGAFCLWVFLCGILAIQPMLQASTRDEPTSVLSELAGLGDTVASSELHPWLEAYNPFEKVPHLNTIHETQQLLGNLDSPDAIRSLMRHPSVMTLREDPEMQRAVKGLVAEPDFVELMTSERPFDENAVMTILKSDAVLHLLDQPSFLDTVKEILREQSAELAETKATTTLYTSAPQ